MPTNHEYWHYVWEYGHTFAGLVVVPLTDPWVRKLLAHWNMVLEETLQEHLERENTQTLIERLGDFQITLANYNSTTQALGMRLSQFDPIEHRMGEAIRSYTSTTEAFSERLRQFDHSFKGCVEALDSLTQDTLNKRSSRVNQFETSTHQALEERLRHFGLSTEEMPIEEVLEKCLDLLEASTKRLLDNRYCSQNLQAEVDKLDHLLKGLQV